MLKTFYFQYGHLLVMDRFTFVHVNKYLKLCRLNWRVLNGLSAFLMLFWSKRENENPWWSYVIKTESKFSKTYLDFARILAACS